MSCSVFQMSSTLYTLKVLYYYYYYFINTKIYIGYNKRIKVMKYPLKVLYCTVQCCILYVAFY